VKILVIGGTAFIGKLLVQDLLAAGHRVAILHRKQRRLFDGRVDQLIADRNDSISVQAAVKGRRFDAVYDNVYDWARGTTAEQVEGTARAVSHSGLRRYIFTSSVAVYGDHQLNCRETHPLVPVNAPNDYQRNKANSERLLLRMFQKEGLPAVTFRPPYVYGPDNMFYREQFFWDRMRLGRKIVLPGGGRRLMHLVYVKDLVCLAVAALTSESAVGQAFNVAGEAPVSQRTLVRTIAQAGGFQPQLVSVPRKLIHALGGERYFAQYFDMPPITEDIGKARRRLGFRPTPLVEGLTETYEWYRKGHKPQVTGFEFEDALLAEAG